MSNKNKKSTDRHRFYPIDTKRIIRVGLELIKHDITMAELARIIGLNKSTVLRVVKGQRKSKKTEQRIAEYLGKPAYFLFGSDDKEYTKKENIQ